MFYIKELVFRGSYCFLGGLNLLFISWFKIKNLQIFYFGYVIPFLKEFSFDESIHFIYTSPIEILETNLKFIFFFALFGFFLLFIQSVFDFLKSSLYTSEIFNLKIYIIFYLLCWYIYTNWVFYDGLLFLITFLQFFLQYVLNLTYFNIFLEFKLLDYIYFFKLLFFYLQKLFIVFYIILFYFSQISLRLLAFNKIYNIYFIYFMFIFICPPEFISQIFSLFLLIVIYEIYLLRSTFKLISIVIYILKFLKYK